MSELQKTALACVTYGMTIGIGVMMVTVHLHAVLSIYGLICLMVGIVGGIYYTNKISQFERINNE